MFVLGVVNRGWPVILSEKSDACEAAKEEVEIKRNCLISSVISEFTDVSERNHVSFGGLLTFAGAPVSDGPGHVSVEALLAVVAVAACGVVTAVHAHASALPPRQLIQLHVESAAARVEVAVARCRGKRVNAVSCVNALADYEKSETLFSGKFPAA